jgi:hypothetical protein
VLLDLLLALSLLASAVNLLRFGGGPIGPGEIGLALWLLLTLTREIARLGPPLTPALSRLLTFWIVFALAMCVGTMTEYAIGDVHDPVWFFHDVIAYFIVAGVSCLTVVEPGAGSRLHRVAWLLTTLGALWLLFQVALGWDVVRVGKLDPWEGNLRLRGFYDDSNTLGLVCAVIAPLSLHLAETAFRPREKIAALMCMIVAIVVGRLTLSDSFMLVLIAASPIFVALTIRSWLLSLERKLTLRSASAWIVVLALPLILVSVVPLGVTIAAQARRLAIGMTREGETGESGQAEKTADLRFQLWKEAILRGTESGMLGLGPGPHLRIPPSIWEGRLETENASDNVGNHPQLKIAPNFEAHNTYLDLFLQGGLVAVSDLVWLVATTLLMTYRANLNALTTLLCGLAIFSAFHLVVRYPLVWFAIAFCLVTGVKTLQPSSVRVGN